eukprot:1867304-Alexandrium_andersonii.AAC.1
MLLQVLPDGARQRLSCKKRSKGARMRPEAALRESCSAFGGLLWFFGILAALFAQQGKVAEDLFC